MAFLYTEEILSELDAALSGISEQDAARLAAAIRQSRRIFLDGLGRSRLSGSAFAMRLVQLGLRSCMVGEVTVPAIGEGDLLIVCSASGASESLLSHVQEAKKAGAAVAAVTGCCGSPISEEADFCVRIPAHGKDDPEPGESILPMGSLFEDASVLFFENLVLVLMREMHETSETMLARHANLE